jgi:hypothetical protein
MRSIGAYGARFLTLILCELLVLQPVSAGQVAEQRTLRIVVVEGTGARNVVQQIAARPLRVRIHDAENQPVAGAVVEFSAPEAGPSGDFDNDSRTITVTTDNEGFASAGSIHPNASTGSYSIRVSAEFQGQTAIAAIQQTNVGRPKNKAKIFAILALVGAGVGAAVYARSGSNDPDPGNVPSLPTISFGGSAVGAPNQ